MSPCHNLEPSLVARDSSRLLSVKPNEWMHLSPFYTRMHGEWLRYAKSTSQFHWRFLLVRDVRGFQVNPLCRHDITSPFPPSGNGGYVRNLDVLLTPLSHTIIFYLQLFNSASSPRTCFRTFGGSLSIPVLVFVSERACGTNYVITQGKENIRQITTLQTAENNKNKHTIHTVDVEDD